MKLNKLVLLSIIAVIALSQTGCYTQLIVKGDGHYEDNTTIIMDLPPAPWPCPAPFLPPSPPPRNPDPEEPKQKYRKPEPPRPPSNEKIRDPLRNSGGRDTEDIRKIR